MTRDNLPPAMKASDADRDAVLADLSEHFQAGRLTAGELEERTGRALTARTWGELEDLVADLPTARPASRARPRSPSRHVAPPPIVAFAGIAIAAVVLVNVVHSGWGLIWPLMAVLCIARPMISRAHAR